MKWKRQTQEIAGTSMFSGHLFITVGVCERVPIKDILRICDDAQAYAIQEKGAHWIQIYESCSGDRLLLLDGVTPAMLESKVYEEEGNHCTLMFEGEY